jgi:glycosyltransferase involved in cell wall biosynthesis
LTVLEANACGTPVVAARVPGLRDSVRHGETGLLVEGGRSEDLAQGILRILGDRSLRERLRRGALDWARRFGWDEVTAAFATCVRAAARRQPLPEMPDWLAGTTVGSPLPNGESAPLAAGEAWQRRS